MGGKHTTVVPVPVTAAPRGIVQRACACAQHGEDCAECKKKKSLLQRKPAGPTPPGVAPAIVHDVLRAPGHALDPATRRFMERRFGHDFGSVRIHTDQTAVESARAVQARAFTVGDHVVFGDGEYDERGAAGRRLLAHELTHVVQQRGGGTGAAPAIQTSLIVGADGDRYEREADRIAEHVVSAAPVAALRASAYGVTSPRAPVLQRAPAPPPPPTCPTTVTLDFTDPAHVPHCGATPLHVHADVPGVTWSLTPGTSAVDPASTIAANGNITLAAAQVAGGDINARASASAAALGGCFVERTFRIRSHPVSISSTSFVASAGGTNYGGTFDHVFDSADGNVASLDNVGVGERFTNVPNPPAAVHNIVAPLWPFGGTFTFNTATLTVNATNNWFLTPAGGLGGTLDSVTTGQADVNVGHFIQSTSNPSPPQGLPATMTLNQRLHWFCPQAAATIANRWTGFVNVPHSRTLRNVGGTLEFVTTVNGVENVDAYVGATGVFNMTASPASTPKSAAAPPGGAAAPAPRTVAITADTLPSALPAGQTITWSMIGAALGCTVAQDPANDHAAILTIGTTAGTVTVQGADSSGVNRARVPVVIT